MTTQLNPRDQFHLPSETDIESIKRDVELNTALIESISTFLDGLDDLRKVTRSKNWGDNGIQQTITDGMVDQRERLVRQTVMYKQICDAYDEWTLLTPEQQDEQLTLIIQMANLVIELRDVDGVIQTLKRLNLVSTLEAATHHQSELTNRFRMLEPLIISPFYPASYHKQGPLMFCDRDWRNAERYVTKTLPDVMQDQRRNH